jgi:Xaa-Pro aminopeptidase
MRVIKSQNEIEIIKETTKWGARAHELLQKYVEVGRYDFEVSSRASLEASLEMKKALGREFRGSGASVFLAYAGIRGQVGENSAFPHAMSIEREIRKGDIIVTGASADVEGYHSEIERNLFVGEPEERVKRYHKIALEMQQAAFNALKPGAKCSDADRAAYNVAKNTA